MDIADRVVVAHVRGRNYIAARLKQWAIQVWGHHLAEPPSVQTFVKGWFALRFSRVEHTNWVLSTVWHIEQVSVLLCRWTPLFDPEQERLEASPL